MFNGTTLAIGGAFAALDEGIHSVEGVGEWLKSAAERMVDLAHKSQELSVSVEQLSRLRFAAQTVGVESETLDHSMLKLQETIGKAAAEGGDAAAKFSALHLNVAELARESPDEQLKAVADAIHNAGSASARSAAEVALLGKSGAELTGLLEQGSAGIGAMAEKADALGITVSDVDAQKVLAASHAIEETEAMVGGLANQIVAKLAPSVADIVNRFVDWAEKTHFVQTAANDVFTAIEYGAAGAVTAYKLIEAQSDAFAAVGVGAVWVLIKGFAELADAGAWVLNKVFGANIDTSGIDNAADKLKAKAQELGDKSRAAANEAFSGAAAARVFEYFDKTTDSANKSAKAAADAAAQYRQALSVPAGPTEDQVKKIGEALADLHKQVDTFGQSDGWKKLWELKHEGANGAQLAEAEALTKQLDTLKQQAEVAKELKKLREDAAVAGMSDYQKQAEHLKGLGASQAQVDEADKLAKEADAKKAAAEEAKRLDEQAKRIKEDGLGPLEKERAHVAELQKLYETGRLTKEQFLKADAASQRTKEQQNPTAVTRGSEAAFALMNQIANRRRAKSAAEEIAKEHLKVAEKQLEETRKGNDRKDAGMKQASIGV